MNRWETLWVGLTDAFAGPAGYTVLAEDDGSQVMTFRSTLLPGDQVCRSTSNRASTD
jgi:hypothetical protein